MHATDKLSVSVNAEKTPCNVSVMFLKTPCKVGCVVVVHVAMLLQIFVDFGPIDKYDKGYKDD